MLSALAAGVNRRRSWRRRHSQAGVKAVAGRPVQFAALAREPRQTLIRLDEALRTLDLANRPLKKEILLACAARSARTGRVTVEEGELLRAISLIHLIAPMPPLLNAGELSDGSR